VAVACLHREIASRTPHAILTGKPLVKTFLTLVDCGRWSFASSMPQQQSVWLSLQLVSEPVSFNLINSPKPEVLNDLDFDNLSACNCLPEVVLDAAPDLCMPLFIKKSDLAVRLRINLMEYSGPIVGSIEVAELLE